MGADATAGIPTADSVTVRMGLPPGPAPLSGSRLPNTVPAHAPSSTAHPMRIHVAAILPNRLRKLDLAAAACSARPRSHARANLRNDNAGGGLAAHLARLVDRLGERHPHAIGEFLHRFGEGLRLDLEPERQHARRCQKLRLP